MYDGVFTTFLTGITLKRIQMVKKIGQNSIKP